ncbi:MAG: diguanylate cyclase [Lachnospiraceae bacterium]|nr:diguanylate cyclase [Lachnospiraceae bacterium]
MKKTWIAVVDDDAISLKNARDLLSSDELRISCVRSGRELLIFIKKNRPDLILLDVMMPEMDGFETYQKLCEYEDEQKLAHVPVIFLTGENDSDVEQKGLMIGASDFIRKPINKEVLLKRIQNIIHNREAIENLTEEANTDKLTGFYNKAYAHENMPQICRENRGMLMILDLDSFKLVNDLFGHDMGDRVLRAFADIARRNCREKDILCRIGGDEFLAFFKDTIDENIAHSFTERLNEQFLDVCASLMGENFDIPTGVSVGCVPVTEKGDYNTLFMLADKAMYQVKQNGKHSCQFYDTSKTGDDSVFDPEDELYRMTTLCSERGKAESAMMLGQEAFISVYRYLDRFAKRHHDGMTKVLMYLNAAEDTDKEEFMDAMSLFGNILQNSFRKNDVITKSRSNCYFLLLSEYTRQDLELIIDRVTEKWADTDYAGRFSIGHVGRVSE